MRIKLVLSKDFNLQDAFHFFTQSNLISTLELKQGLERLEVVDPEGMSTLLMDRYSHKAFEPKTFNLFGLSSLFTPVNFSHSNDLTQKSQHKKSLSSRTLDLMRRTLECLVLSHKKIEEVIKENQRKLNIKNAFRIMDKGLKAYLNKEDLQSFLGEQGHLLSDLDLDLLLRLYTRKNEK